MLHCDKTSPIAQLTGHATSQVAAKPISTKRLAPGTNLGFNLKRMG
jgi:hypothetical protein